MEARQLRDRAHEALAKGRFARAAELYEEYSRVEPRDFQARVRLGDAWVKAGNSARAISAYQTAAEGFAREGFLPRAIAASKLILELDPSHQGVQRMLADLYARRGMGPARAPKEAPRAVDEVPRAQAAPPPEPSADIEVEVALESGEEGAGPGIEVELDLSEAEQASPPAAPVRPSGAMAAPPGLKPRRASDARPTRPRQEVAPSPVAPEPPSRAASRIERFTPADGIPFDAPVPGGSPFTELELEADSLLHAVELAAQASLERNPEAGPAGAEEPELIPGEEESPGAPLPDALPKSPLFSDLPPDAFIALFERCPLRRFPEGARIIEQGSRGNAFYVICEGRVRVVRQSGAEHRELAVLEEGAFFGEMALLSGAPRSASVVSLAEETQVLEISAPVLAELSRRHPQVARALKKFVRQRLLGELMNTSALFKPFARKDRRELVERFRARDVRRGEVLIREGQQVDGLYVVLSGEVEVRKAERHLARLREGELFGEMSLLQKAPANATVVATRRTSLLRLPREDFDTLILTHPQILALVSELTETRQRQTDALLGEGAGSGTEDTEDLILV